MYEFWLFYILFVFFSWSLLICKLSYFLYYCHHRDKDAVRWLKMNDRLKCVGLKNRCISKWFTIVSYKMTTIATILLQSISNLSPNTVNHQSIANYNLSPIYRHLQSIINLQQTVNGSSYWSYSSRSLPLTTYKQMALGVIQLKVWFMMFCCLWIHAWILKHMFILILKVGVWI